MLPDIREIDWDHVLGRALLIMLVSALTSATIAIWVIILFVRGLS